jgi:hypothetical protein
VLGFLAGATAAVIGFGSKVAAERTVALDAPHASTAVLGVGVLLMVTGELLLAVGDMQDSLKHPQDENARGR